MYTVTLFCKEKQEETVAFRFSHHGKGAKPCDCLYCLCNIFVCEKEKKTCHCGMNFSFKNLTSNN